MQIEHLNGLSPVWVFQCLDNVDGGHKRSRQDQRSRWAPLQQPILGKAHPTVLARISLVQPLFRHPVNNRHNYPSKSRQKVDCPTHMTNMSEHSLEAGQEGAYTSQELPVFHIYVLFSFHFHVCSPPHLRSGRFKEVLVARIFHHLLLSERGHLLNKHQDFSLTIDYMKEHVPCISSCFRQVQNS